MAGDTNNPAPHQVIHTAPSDKKFAHPVAWIWTTGVLLIGLVIAGSCWSLWQVYEAERREAIQSVSNLALAVSGQIGALIRNGDAYLASTATLAEFDADGRLVNAEQVHRMLADWRLRQSGISRISVTGNDGRSLVDVNSAAPGPAPYAISTPMLRFVPGNARADFFISTPRLDQLTGQQIVVFRRPIARADGRPLGAVEMVVPVDGLSRMFSTYEVGPEGSLSMVLLDPAEQKRVVLARLPYDEQRIGRTFQTTPQLRERFSFGGVEIYFGSGLVDGVPRLFASRQVDNYPVLITVGTVWRNIIDRWYQNAPEILSAIVGAVFFIAILTFALAWQIGGRLRSEQRLSNTLGELANQRRSELEAQQSKLDALARMAGGVAHEFSNLLQPITTLSDLGRKVLPSDPEALGRTAQYFDRIGMSARQAVAIAGDFLTFCGSSQRRGRLAEIRPALLLAARQVQPLLGERCKLQVAVPSELQAYFDDIGLGQIVMNVVKNSIEAWQRQPSAPLNIVIAATSRPAGRVELRITDDGPGMTDEVRARIFEPFFTTKGASGGTGLGLSVIYGIITSWGGTVDVQSRPGLGTATIIELRSSAGGRQDDANGDDENAKPRAA